MILKQYHFKNEKSLKFAALEIIDLFCFVYVW